MVYDDPLSQWCLEKDPNWPPKYYLEQKKMDLDAINSDLKQYDFNLDEWITYKLKMPNDGRERKYQHPEVEYLLTKEEFKALKDSEERPMDVIIEYDPVSYCNPTLCPKAWQKYAQQFGQFYQRFWWLISQLNWLEFGYPQPPREIWEKNDFILSIFEELVYKPFIDYWGTPPDEFWIYLSEILEGENKHRLLQAFVLYFHSIGRIFPSPSFLDVEGDYDPDSIFE